jgi:hypothetical protein
MEELQISDSVVRKIQLLLKLAERVEGNEAEAAAAMGRAQELLAKYNLDLSTVTDKVVAGGTNTPEDAMAKRDYAKGSRSALYQWQRKLVRVVAEANYCRYWHVKEMCGTPLRLRNRHKVLGRVANTTAVLVMVDYLFDTIERLLPAEYAALGRRSQEASLWREGCADRLAERIEEKAQAMRSADYATQGEAAYSTAIAVRNFVSKEEIGNYDFLNGEGAWARREARNAKWLEDSKANAARRAENDAKELAELEAKVANETPKEKAARLKKEAKEEAASRRYSARYWAREDRKADRNDARRNTSAYASGSQTAEKIGLDGQLQKGRENKKLD